jgi:hypothetical protein
VVLPGAIKLGYHEELVNSYSHVDSGILKRTKIIKKPKNKKKRKIRSR